MFNQKQHRIVFAYIALQAIIWAKCALFFVWFGHGKSMQFSFQDFPESAIVFDYFFHNGMHFLIALLALLFGASMPRINQVKPAAAAHAIAKLAAIVLIAVALHNAAYWFTATHPGIEYTLFDFTRDFVMLSAFVLAGFLLNAIWVKIKRKQALGKHLNF